MSAEAPGIIEALAAANRLPAAVRDLLGRAGIELPRSPAPGQSYAVQCPWHDDHDPSLVVVEHAGMVECKGACGRRWLLLDLAIQVGVATTHAAAARWLSDTFIAMPGGLAAPATEPAAVEPNKPDYAAWYLRSREGLDWSALVAGDPRFDLTAAWPRAALERVGAGFAPAKEIRGTAYPASLVFPIQDADGNVIGVKLRALTPPSDGVKSRTVGGGKGFVGLGQLAAKPEALVVICAGEKDVVFGTSVCPQFAWVSLASGEGSKPRDAVRALADRDVVVLYDADDGGRQGAPVIADLVSAHARTVRVAEFPADVLTGTPDQKDVADVVRKFGDGAGHVLERVIADAATFDGGAQDLAGADDVSKIEGRVVVVVPGEHPQPEGARLVVSEFEFASDVLSRLPPGTLYRRDDVVGELKESDGSVSFVEITVDRARLAISAHVCGAIWKSRKGAAPRLAAHCWTRDLAGLVVAAAKTSPHVRELRALVRYPVHCGAAFTLCSPGWNEATGIYYAEPEALRGVQPADVEVGRIPELLRNMLVDFKFADEASVQNFVGLLLTPFVRPALQPGHTPGHVALAPAPRIGKTKLIGTVLGFLVLGREVFPIRLGANEEEQDKRITSLLLQGATIINFDNVSVLDSGPLAMLLTSDVYCGRRLGVSEVVLLPNTLTVVATGNNLQSSAEMVRRFVPIWLRATCANPEDRNDFVHKDLEAYLLTVRREVVSVLLGMVEAWRRAGRPLGQRPLGGFEAWARVIGGILGLFGCTNWLANYREFIRTGDTDGEDCKTLVEQWRKVHGTNEVRASDLWNLVAGSDLFPTLREKPNEASRLTAFGKFLQSKVGTIVGEWRILDRSRGTTRLYRLVDLCASTPAADPADREICVNCGAEKAPGAGCDCVERGTSLGGAA